MQRQTQKKDEENAALVEGNEQEEPTKTSSAPAKDSHKKSLLKGISWRVVASLTTITISWWVLGDASTALTIGFFEALFKIGIYYLHERAWAQVAI